MFVTSSLALEVTSLTDLRSSLPHLRPLFQAATSLFCPKGFSSVQDMMHILRVMLGLTVEEWLLPMKYVFVTMMMMVFVAANCMALGLMGAPNSPDLGALGSAGGTAATRSLHAPRTAGGAERHEDTVAGVDPQIARLSPAERLRQAVGTKKAGACEADISFVNSCDSEELLCQSSHVRVRLTSTDTPLARLARVPVVSADSAASVPVSAVVMSNAQVAASACDDHDAVHARTRFGSQVPRGRQGTKVGVTSPSEDKNSAPRGDRGLSSDGWRSTGGRLWDPVQGGAL